MRAASFFLLAVVLAACSATGRMPDGATTEKSAGSENRSYLTAASGCAVVAGGGLGSRFSDPKITEFWQKVNSSVTTELYDRLVLNKYKVVKLLVPVEEAQNNQQIVIRSLATNRCNRLIQVSHTVDEDDGGKFFRFDVAMMRLEPKGDRQPGATGTSVKTVGEFRHEYRFPRNPETFDSFRTGTFAESVLVDLRRSGRLEALR